MKLFEASGQSLRFTCEMALDNAIKFFDIRITFKVDNLCWFYSPRAKKCLLPYKSVLSELIKRGIAMACLKAALDKSGHHEMLKSCRRQFESLAAAKYPHSFLLNVCKSFLQKMKSTCVISNREKERKSRVGIPYTHRISHNLKKAVSKYYHVNVVFSAPCKLSKIFYFATKKNHKQCGKNYVDPFTRRATQSGV